MTLLEVIQGAFVGKTVRFANIKGEQSWLCDYVVRIESIELEADAYGGGDVTADFSLRSVSDNEVFHLSNARLDAVEMIEVAQV